MQTERDVHLKLSDRFGIARPKSTARVDAGTAVSDDVLFF
jgi:hypothetical protein